MAKKNEETKTGCPYPPKGKSAAMCGGSGAIYGLGILGAWVYFFQHATTFWEGVVGFFQGILWPAVILHKVLELLKI